MSTTVGPIDRDLRPAEKHSGTKNIGNFFISRGDRQLTEIFVSGTEVFSDGKMTESPYE